MRTTIRKYSIIGIACAASVIILACGGNGAANNDQGVAVTFLGIYGSVPTPNQGGGTGNTSRGCVQIPAPLGITSIVLGDSSARTTAAVGVQNNLSGQFFRADRIFLDYFIPGAALQPPSTNLLVTVFAGPAEAGSQGGGQAGGQAGGAVATPVSSLPPTFNRNCNTAFVLTSIVPAVITEWLNVNSASLPAAPYILEVTARITGISSSGKVYETNPAFLPIDVLPQGSAQASASEADAPFVDDSEISDQDKFNDDWTGDGDVAPEPEVEQDEDLDTEIVVEE
ncbi:MAG: hypothetical protein WCN89_01950 [bacterium]